MVSATAANVTNENGAAVVAAPEKVAAKVGQATEVPLAETQRNVRRKKQAENVLAGLFEMGLTEGFFGTAAITIAFHDGNIQHITRRIEHIIKN